MPSLCALADLVVLVVSKEKYADQSVWEILRLIGKTCKGLLVAVNKTTESAAEQLVQAIGNKFDQEGLSCSNIQALPYVAAAQAAHLLTGHAADALQRLTQETLKQEKPLLSHSELKAFLHQHWHSWTAPVLHEHRATQDWRETVDRACAESLQQFERDYLKKTEYRETLDQAIMQLLRLLEIPGMAEPLAKVRHVLTWPARTAIQWAKKTRGLTDDRPQETVILDEILQQTLMKLQRHCGEQAVRRSAEEQEWWRRLWRHVHTRQNLIHRHGGGLIETHQTHFQPEIEAAALRLHEHLKAHPTTLNTLRATRLGVDAAAVALAIKTGGVGLNDLFLTPAMLSISTMLTEGAVGQYMSSVERELKQAQKESIHTHLMQPLAEELKRLIGEMPQAGLFGLSEQALADAEQVIEELV